jgi:hypothetical protein
VPQGTVQINSGGFGRPFVDSRRRNEIRQTSCQSGRASLVRKIPHGELSIDR